MFVRLVFGATLAVSAALSSCAPRPAAPDAMSWNYFDDGEEAKLAYGEPNSDAVGLMLTCKPHSRAIVVSGETPGRTRLTLVSGRDRTILSGPAEDDPMTGSPWIEAQTPIDRGAIAGFARTGRLDVEGGGRTTSFGASGQDRAAVDRFFRTCA
jgi:hypothetical protein